MNFTFVVAIWALLGATTLVLAAYRLIFATHNEEDVVRLAPGEEGEVKKQAVLARRLAGIDGWGVPMTVITVIMGFGLAGGYLYQAWESPNPGPNNFYR